MDGFQRLDILGIARVGHSRCVRDGQFFPHVAGKVLVVSLPLVRLRVQKDESLQVGQILRHWLVEQIGHVVEVNTTVLIQGDEQSLLGRADGLDRLPVMNRALSAPQPTYLTSTDFSSGVAGRSSASSCRSISMAAMFF